MTRERPNQYTKRCTLRYAQPNVCLFRKLRKRLYARKTLDFFPSRSLELAQIWTLLHAMSQPGQLSFAAERRVRSVEFSQLHLYLMRRLVSNLGDPPWSRLLSILNRTMRFRNCPLPPSPSPLVLPFLAHESFAVDLKAWLRHHIIKAKEFLPPYPLQADT